LTKKAVLAVITAAAVVAAAQGPDPLAGDEVAAGDPEDLTLDRGGAR